MYKQITKYLSLFLLSLFLFPMAEKGVHALEHSTDIYCTAGSKHFHNIEHNCAICDFSINDSNNPVNSPSQFVVPCGRVSFNFFSESVNAPCAFQDIPSRAPPTI